MSRWQALWWPPRKACAPMNAPSPDEPIDTRHRLGRTETLKATASRLVLCAAIVAPAVQASAADFDARGRTWFVIEETGTGMVAIGRDPRSDDRRPSVLVATLHATPQLSNEHESVWDGERGERTEVVIRYDYDVALVDLDCGAEGRHRHLGNRSYRLGQTSPVSSSSEQGRWEGPTKSPFTGEVLHVPDAWSIGCNAGNAGRPIGSVRSYEGMVTAYRQRLDEQRKVELKGLAASRESEWRHAIAQAEAGVVPETSLAIAKDPVHWHAGLLPSGIVMAWDRHGARPGSRPGSKRMSHAVFLLLTTPRWEAATAKAPPSDFTVAHSEFDCGSTGKWRPLATARYAMLDGAARPMQASRTPDSDWSTSGINTWFWQMACTEADEASALPAKTTFEEILQSTRK